MNVPPAIISYMNTIPSNKGSYIPEHDVERYLNGYAPGIHEGLISDCGDTNEEDRQRTNNYIMKML
jgi:hypothetical protein